MEKHIEVWYDETSDSNEPAYCVSLCAEDGSEIRCLSTHDDRAEAEVAGLAAAAKREVECLYRAVSGETCPL